MGGKNDKAIHYELPLNYELNDNIEKSIIHNNNHQDNEKFKRLIHKNIKSNIKRSCFKEKFYNNSYYNITSFMNLIYSNSTNSVLKEKSNRTLYETIFNYDIVENKGEGYKKYSTNILNTMKTFITGEKNSNSLIDNNIYNNSDIFETFKMSNQQENSLSTEKLNKNNYQNTYNIDEYSDLNNKIINPSNLNYDENVSNIISEDQNINSIIQSNSIVKEVKIPKVKKKSRSTSKKKHSKEPKKRPLVNIKLDLRDLIKQDVREKSNLSPRQRYSNNYKSKSPVYNNNKIQKGLNNIKSLGPQSISNNYIHDEDFINMVDRLSQPNKLEKEIIHNKNSINKTNRKIIKKI
jgi:hypothetical protein